MWSSWPGAGHRRLSSAIRTSPGTRSTIEARLPDVIRAMFDAGAQPGMMDDARREPDPRDAEPTSIIIRRPLLEGVLRRIGDVEPRLTIDRGVIEKGLVAVAGADDIPV